MGSAGRDADDDERRRVHALPRTTTSRSGRASSRFRAPSPINEMSEPSADVTRLHVFCAGAAKGLVEAARRRASPSRAGARVEARFGAVGAMKEALLGGRACDVMIVTDAMIDALASTRRAAWAQHARRSAACAPASRCVPATRCPTSRARRSAASRRCSRADGIYFPDPERATAGIHFAAVLRKLGIDDAVAARLRAVSERRDRDARARRRRADACPIGCTQITEINYTAGVRARRRAAASSSSSRPSTAPRSARARRDPSWRCVSSGAWRTRRHARFGRPAVRVGAFVGRQRHRLGGSADNGAGWRPIAVAARCPVMCWRRGPAVAKETTMTLGTILLIILILLLLGVVPTWPHSRVGLRSERNPRRGAGRRHRAAVDGAPLSAAPQA